MTARPPGGGPRSLGASLLDDVLAETVDPAYAQAAEARAALSTAVATVTATRTRTTRVTRSTSASTRSV